MAEVKRDLHILVSIAKLDAELDECRKDSAALPGKIAEVTKALADIDATEKRTAEALEETTKERRGIEQKVEDSQEKIKKLRVQLMEVKTNKEYTAMLHEIEHLEKAIDSGEEQLLLLMEKLDEQQAENKQLGEEFSKKKSELNSEKAKLEARLKELQSKDEKIESEKPKLLNELEPALKKRYNRLLDKLGNLAVTHVDQDICQGCFTRLPPQQALEVRNNDRIITCEACGRILVYYLA